MIKTNKNCFHWLNIREYNVGLFFVHLCLNVTFVLTKQDDISPMILPITVRVVTLGHKSFRLDKMQQTLDFFRSDLNIFWTVLQNVLKYDLRKSNICPILANLTQFGYQIWYPWSRCNIYCWVLVLDWTVPMWIRVVRDDSFISPVKTCQ